MLTVVVQVQTFTGLVIIEKKGIENSQVTLRLPWAAWSYAVGSRRNVKPMPL